MAIYCWSEFRLGNSLFGNVQLTTSTDPDKYKYFGYGTGFDESGSCSLFDDSKFSKSVMIFGADISLSVHIDDRKNIS